jgi:hypothetical protein
MECALSTVRRRTKFSSLQVELLETFPAHGRGRAAKGSVGTPEGRRDRGGQHPEHEQESPHVPASRRGF